MNSLVNAVYLAAIGLAAVFGYVLVTKGPKAVADAANAVNPLNQNNAIKTGVDKVVQKITGDANDTFGAKFFEWTHPATVAREKALSTPIPPAAPATSAQPGQGVGPAPTFYVPGLGELPGDLGIVFGGGA